MRGNSGLSPEVVAAPLSQHVGSDLGDMEQKILSPGSPRGNAAEKVPSKSVSKPTVMKNVFSDMVKTSSKVTPAREKTMKTTSFVSDSGGSIKQPEFIQGDFGISHVSSDASQGGVNSNASQGGTHGNSGATANGGGVGAPSLAIDVAESKNDNIDESKSDTGIIPSNTSKTSHKKRGHFSACCPWFVAQPSNDVTSRSTADVSRQAGAKKRTRRKCPCIPCLRKREKDNTGDRRNLILGAQAEIPPPLQPGGADSSRAGGMGGGGGTASSKDAKSPREGLVAGTVERQEDVLVEEKMKLRTTESEVAGGNAIGYDIKVAVRSKDHIESGFSDCISSFSELLNRNLEEDIKEAGGSIKSVNKILTSRNLNLNIAKTPGAGVGGGVAGGLTTESKTWEEQLADLQTQGIENLGLVEKGIEDLQDQILDIWQKTKGVVNATPQEDRGAPNGRRDSVDHIISDDGALEKQAIILDDGIEEQADSSKTSINVFAIRDGAAQTGSPPSIGKEGTSKTGSHKKSNFNVSPAIGDKPVKVRISINKIYDSFSDPGDDEKIESRDNKNGNIRKYGTDRHIYDWEDTNPGHGFDIFERVMLSKIYHRYPHSDKKSKELLPIQAQLFTKEPNDNPVCFLLARSNNINTIVYRVKKGGFIPPHGRGTDGGNVTIAGVSTGVSTADGLVKYYQSAQLTNVDKPMELHWMDFAHPPAIDYDYKSELNILESLIFGIKKQKWLDECRCEFILYCLPSRKLRLEFDDSSPYGRPLVWVVLNARRCILWYLYASVKEKTFQNAMLPKIHYINVHGYCPELGEEVIETIF